MTDDLLFAAPVQSRETDERYTPAWIFAALGETFDLDPASPPLGESQVPTKAVWTKDDDGLTQPWHGLVWLNPPFSHATAWADRFMEHANGIWLGPVANSDWHCRMMRSSDAMILMRDFPFIAPTHAGKRSSLPLSMHAIGQQATVALARLATLQPEAGVLMLRAPEGWKGQATPVLESACLKANPLPRSGLRAYLDGERPTNSRPLNPTDRARLQHALREQDGWQQP